MADSSLIHAGSFYPAAPAASANTSTSHPTTSSPWQATILTQYNEASTSPSHASNPPLHTLAAPAYHAIKEIPRLSDLCRRILKANVAHIQDVGDVTYDLLRDILPGCRVDQLRDIEELSPHIAEEDEEIWSAFFHRDFPIVAEARARAAACEKTPEASGSKSQSSTTHKGDKGEAKEEEDGSHTDEDLFVSYRDLYYDEQLRREERLATAGQRLKARLNNIAQQKSSRQTILDPRLSLNLRKRRRGVTLPTGRGMHAPPLHWSKAETRPKTLAEKARAKASQIAFGLGPHRLTRSNSMAVGLIKSGPRPLYKEPSLESDTVTPQLSLPSKGIFGPRRGIVSKPSKDSGVDSEYRPSVQPEFTRSAIGTKFVERTVAVASKSSMHRPHKASTSLAGPPPLKSSRTILPASMTSAPSTVASSPSNATCVSAAPRKAIPGITRKTMPQHLGSGDTNPVKSIGKDLESGQSAINTAPKGGLERSTIMSPASSPPPATSSSAPSTQSPAGDLSLPMFSQPRRLPPGPSLFIPRKKRKVA